MKMMSSFKSVRYAAALQPAVSDQRPRAPISEVLATTLLSGGSARKLFGSRPGAAGSAQGNSIGVGARMPSLYEIYVLVAGFGLKFRPAAGLKRVNVWSPFKAGSSPVLS